MLKRFRTIVLLLILVATLGAAALGWIVVSPMSLRTSPLDFQIEAGSSLRSASRQIAEAGIGVDPLVFVLLGKLTRSESAIKAGSYEVATGTTPWELLRKLTRGDQTQADIVLVEGFTFRQFRDRIDANPDLRHDSAGLADAEVLKRVGAAEAAGEGLFFPDTYQFAKRGSDFDLLRRAYRIMQQKLAAEWEHRATGLPYRTAYEALIVASLVEKETGVAADRPRIAAVFANRLRIGMPLQTDPSVIYGIGPAFDGNLRKRDLQADTPYNTYTRTGLPPTPIAMPGLASIQATLHPADSDALYFVARGDGSSEFSRTLDAHNRAVARYQKGERP